MDKKELAKKVAGLINVSEEYQKLAFSQFKKKLSEYLKVGEAVKIINLGVFQVKQQLEHSDEAGKIISKDKSLTLVFSPESRTSEDDSIFLNLELEEKSLDENEFDEKVFQIGIDKPLITSAESEIENDSIQKDIADSISALLNDSEKIKNFDLWEDHLKNKETKDIIDELGEEIEGNIIEPELNDKLSEIENALYEKDFEEMDENEIFDEIIDETDLITEEDINEIMNDEDKIKEVENSQLFEENEKVSEDLISEYDNSMDDEKSIIDNTNAFVEEEKQNENIKNDIELELKEGYPSEQEDYKENKIEEPIVDSPEIVKEEIDNDENDLLLNEEESFDEEITDSKSFENKDLKFEDKKKKKSLLIYFLVAAFLILGAIGIYYIFFNKNNLERYEQLESITGNIEEAPGDAINNLDEPIVETQVKDELYISPKVEETEEDIVENTNVNSSNDGAESNKIDSPDKEKEVAENIYFDGFVYNVQISSWKQRSVADRELQKLIDKGFPAFVIKVYIPKFDGDWHRVRIGPYPSLKAAKQAQEELNMKLR